MLHLLLEYALPRLIALIEVASTPFLLKLQRVPSKDTLGFLSISLKYRLEVPPLCSTAERTLRSATTSKAGTIVEVPKPQNEPWQFEIQIMMAVVDKGLELKGITRDV